MRALIQHRFLPLVPAALVGIIYLAVAPQTADLAAQVYRVELWREVGFSVWDSQWYGGHHVPAYSLVFPPLGALLGPRLVGVLASLVAIALFIPIARKLTGSPAVAAIASGFFASSVMTNVIVGRMPFTLGLMFGVAVWACLLREPGYIDGKARLLAIALAITTVVSSPVAGLFLLITLAAWGLAQRENFLSALMVGLPTVSVGLALAIAFPEGGTQPFSASSFWPLFLICLFATFLLRNQRRGLLLGAIFYLVVLVLAFIVPAPVGSNALRMGVVAGPALLILGALDFSSAWPRLAAVAMTSIALSYLAWTPAVDALKKTKSDPSTALAFYSEVERFFDKAGEPGERIEIPFTKNHWEAAYLAPKLQLARGWERQLDVKHNGIFYEGELTAVNYRAWLETNGVQWVALADVPLDRWAEDEKALLLTGLDYLQPVYESRHWKIWRVRGARPPVSKPAWPLKVSQNGFEIQTPRPGTVNVRIRYTPYWKVTAGSACVTATPDGWTNVEVLKEGVVSVEARFSLSAAARREAKCVLDPVGPPAPTGGRRSSP